MDQLYDAMPLPSSDDEVDHQRGGAAPHRSNDASGLDISAHGSFTDSSRSSSSPSTTAPDEDQQGNNSTTNANAARHNAHHRAFTTTSSPEELYAFLTSLLHLAEELNDRLCRALPDAASPLRSSSRAPSAPPPLQQGNAALQSTDTALAPSVVASRVEEGVLEGDSASKQRAARGAHDSTLHHAFIGSTTCHGLAKLRGRLRKETENLRRAVDGLREAGCKGVDAVTSDQHSSSRTCSAAGALPQSKVNVSPALFSAAVSCAQCNSIAHFEGVVTCLEREQRVTGVYVPISGHIGPPQCRPSHNTPTARSTQGADKPAFSDHVRIEVDVVSSDEHRWIKVKTATPRNLELEAAALELNGSTPFTDMLLALCTRARRACLPHRRTAHVAVVLLHPPPPPLRDFLAHHRIAWAALASCNPHRPLRARRGVHGTAPSPATAAAAAAWLPPLSLPPKFVCLDTTALVTLCSQSCYVDAMPLSVRLAQLQPFHVLQEQQRKEANDCAAVVAVMEPALRGYTRWCTAGEMNEGMRQALLREDDDELCGGTTTPTDANVHTGTEQPSPHTPSVAPEAAQQARAAQVPTSLVDTEVDLSWLAPLQQAAEAHRRDAPTNTAPAESQLLVEMSGLLSREVDRRPNWFIADVTYEEFRWILETIAGPAEVARAARLLPLVTVVKTGFLRERMRVERGVAGVAANSPADADTARKADHAQGVPAGGGGGDSNDSDTRGAAGVGFRESASCEAVGTTAASLPPLLTSVEYLRLSGKVSLRNKIVFGLADAVEAVVVTSNEQLCHAAREQGVCLEACFHPSRSLTEQKMYQLRRRHGPGKPPAVL